MPPRIIAIIKLSKSIQLTIVISILLLVFLPSLFAEVCNVDDLDMLKGLRSVTGFDILSIFIPKSGSGLYYRPFIGLSFHIDRYLFSLDPFVMHFHNVLIHIFNTVIVYFVACLVVNVKKNEASFLPLVMTLLFGLHPLTTESVNWISGRTDLLASFFLLCATVCIFRYKEKQSLILCCATILFIVFAVLTKEFALAYIPCAAFLFFYTDTRYAEDQKINLNFILLFIGITIVVITSFLLLRDIAFTSNSSRIGMTIRYLMVDPQRTLTVFSGAFAFYLKKIYWPFPLNFAIVQIDPLYELLSIPLLAICLRSLISRSIAATMFITGVLLYSPAFLIAFNQIAWTPYAERYAYLSSAFIIIGTIIYFEKRINGRFTNIRKIVYCLLVLAAASTTYSRNMIWHYNYTLLEDTVEKSPYAVESRLLYGSLLAEKGLHESALLELEYGKKLPGLGYDERFDINIADIYTKEHRFDEAINVLEEGLKKSKGRSVLITKELVKLLSHKLLNEKDVIACKSIGIRIIDLYLALYKINYDDTQLVPVRELLSRIGDDDMDKHFSGELSKLPRK